jgi:hypothetical protein
MTNLFGEQLEDVVRQETRDAILSALPAHKVSELLISHIQALIETLPPGDVTETRLLEQQLFRAYRAARDEALDILLEPRYARHHEVAGYVANVLHT